MQYFKKFWSNNIIENLATQTNIYSVQKSGKCIDTNAQEIEKFIGTQMLMSVMTLPSYELNWSKDLCVDCVANVMSLKRYELMRRYLHANNNTEKKDDPSILFKVEPVVHALCTNCLSVEQEQYLSIDEQMVHPKQKEVEFANTYQRRFTSGDTKTLFRQVLLESFTISFSTQDKKLLGERNVVRLK